MYANHKNISFFSLVTFYFQTFCFFYLCLLLFSGWARAEEKIYIGHEDWAPFQYVDNNKKLTGLDIELINAILSHAGFQSSFQPMPWKRILQSVKDGRIDLAMSATPTDDRKKYAYFSIPYRSEVYSLFVRKGEIGKYNFSKLQDIANHSSFRLGIVRGYFLGDDYNKLSKTPQFESRIQEVSRDILNIKKIISKRIDGFLGEPAFVNFHLEKLNLQYEIVRHPMEIFTSDVHLMLSKKNVSQEMVEKINLSVEELKSNGTSQLIINKYQ